MQAFDIPIPLFVPIGAVVAACITGAVSFVTMSVSKDQKISDFRQSWIDAFRDELATFAGHARRLAYERTPVHIDRIGISVINLLQKEDEDAQRPDQFHENRQRMAQSYYAIRLRLNKSEPDHTKLLQNLDAVYRALNEYSNISRREECLKELDALSLTSQDVLKREWTRVKSGEPGYIFAVRFFKFGALLLSALLACLLGYAIWAQIERPSRSVEAASNNVAQTIDSGRSDRSLDPTSGILQRELPLRTESRI